METVALPGYDLGSWSRLSPKTRGFLDEVGWLDEGREKFPVFFLETFRESNNILHIFLRHDDMFCFTKIWMIQDSSLFALSRFMGQRHMFSAQPSLQRCDTVLMYSFAR